MFYWIYDYLSWAIGTLFALAFIAITWVAIYVFRKFFHSWFHREKRSNEMVGFVLSSYAVLYGLLLGLIAVGAYQPGSDPLLDEAVAMYPRLQAFLQQGMDEREDFDDAAASLHRIFEA